MNTLNQVFLLNNINFIFTTTIMFMIIFIYSLERRSRYISFLIIYSIELILFLSFKQNFFNSYSINIAVIFIVKILWVILNLNSIRANRLKKIELISINILGLLVINESILLAFCINLVVNFSVFYNIVYKMLYKNRKKSKLLSVSLSLIISGALGNFYDRVVYKYVVDFICVHYKNTYYFPTFNVADVFVVCGTILLAIYILRMESDGEL